MALTRKLLKSFGLEESVIESIIEAHGETVEALKQQRDDALSEAGKAPEIIKERDQLKQQVEELRKSGGDAARVQADFDAYKQQVETDRRNAAKQSAFDALLKEAGVVKDSFRSILRKTVSMDEIDMDESGAIRDADALRERIRTDYADFISEEVETGTKTLNPPPGPAKRLTREQIKAMSPAEINKNWDSIKDQLADLK